MADSVVDTEDAVRRLLAGTGGLIPVDLASLPAIRNGVYSAQPDLFVGSECALAGEAALVWLPQRPRVMLEVRASHNIGPADLEIIPGLAFVGAKPKDLSAGRFWLDEVRSRSNLIAWTVAVLALASLVVLQGPRVLSVIAAPVAVYFAVFLPVLPLFFRPAVEADLLPFYLQGRLGRWQTAETQMFRAAALGFALSVALQVASTDESPDPLGQRVLWLAVVAIVLIAIWLLLAMIAYALPLVHSLDTARAVREWRDEKLNGRFGRGRSGGDGAAVDH